MAPPFFVLPNPFSLHLLLLPEMHDPIFFLLFASLSFLSLTFLSFSLYKRFSKTEKHNTREQQQHGLTRNPEIHDPTIASEHSPSRVVDEGENSPTHLTSSVLLEVLPPDSAKWASLFDDPNSVSSGPGGKKKRKKAKKKRMNSVAEEKTNTGSDPEVRLQSGCCLYPFTSSSSAMQRRIKQQYDELLRCSDSKKLTLTQVVQFANSLVDARNELQHKAGVVQRRFVITKALLCKADRSSFDRLRQQIYKLEFEQKRLEEDAFVYNSLQQQLKLSPAYQKMLEVGACMEKAKSCELEENKDDEFADISFEELLAQEKKDSFWLVSFCSFSPSCFIKFESSWEPLLFDLEGEGLACYSPITTLSVFAQAKKWEIKTMLKLITVLVCLTVTRVSLVCRSYIYNLVLSQECSFWFFACAIFGI